MANNIAFLAHELAGRYDDAGDLRGDGFADAAPTDLMEGSSSYEYAGAVIAARGGYYANNPVTIYQQHDFGFTLPSGETPVALYHTHPPDTNSDSFSVHNVKMARQLQMPSYIGVYATDSIRYFDPSTMSSVMTRNLAVERT